MTNPRRLPGWAVAAGLLGLIALTVSSALFFWFRGREPMGPIASLAPIDGTRVMIVRRGYAQNDFVHLTMRELGVGQRWSIALFSVQPGAEPAIHGDLVALRVRDALGRPETHGFRISEGAFAWRAGAVPLRASEEVRAADVLEDGVLYEVYGGREGRALAIAMDDGRVVFETRRAGGEGPVHLVVGSDGVYADLGVGEVTRFDRTTGASTELGSGSICGIAGDVYRLGPSGLVRGDASIPLADLPPDAVLRACERTRNGDLLVVAGPEDARVVLVSGATGRIASRVGGLGEGVDPSRARVLPGHDGDVTFVGDDGSVRETRRFRGAAAPTVRALPRGTSIAAGDTLVLDDGRTRRAVTVTTPDAAPITSVRVSGDVAFVVAGASVVSLSLANGAVRETSGDVTVREVPEGQVLPTR